MTGCAWLSEPDPVTLVITPDITIVDRPSPLQLKPIEFSAVSSRNVEEFLVNNENRHGEIVFIALEVFDYENLALNMGELKRFIEEQQAIIKYYEKRITDVSAERTQPE